jgi:hypothetical protein
MRRIQVIERRRSRSQSKVVSPPPGPWWRLFGPPNILEGENAAAYEDLLAQISAAIRPKDVIEEMFVVDVTSLEWEILRLRRLKLSLIRAQGIEALEEFLRDKLCYDAYLKYFVHDLAEVLQNNLLEDASEDAQALARGCAQNESDAVDKVNEILAHGPMDMDDVLNSARARKAKKLAQQYVRREPDAITLVNEVLEKAGMSMDMFMADALAEKLDDIERIDRLTTIAENRRNDALNEIERRRALFGETLRRSVQEIEDGEFKMIDAPAKGKNAA